MKQSFFKLFFAISFLLTNSTIAQYTDIINSNKPGFSESPYSVGSGVYQFESNFFTKNTNISPIFSKPQSLGIDVLFRTSFFLERLEFNTQITYQKDKVAFNNIFTSHYFNSGISKLTVGAKYLLFEPTYTDKSKEVRSWKKRNAFDYKRFIPSVAIYLGVNTDFINSLYQTNKISPKIGVLLQQNLTNDFNIISNIFYDKAGTEFTEISYIVTATQNFGERWSGFLEHQAIIEKYQNNLNFGLGVAYLFSRNLQVNTSFRSIKEGKSEGFYGGFGVSYRIDKHQDTYKDLNEIESKLKDTPITRYNNRNRSFFSKIFSVFKKNKRTSRKRKRK